MVTSIRCSVCGGTFSSTEDYTRHSCTNSKVLGSSGDIKSESASQYAKEGGTGGGRP